MHSKNRESNERGMRALATTGLIVAALALAGAAEAHDHRGHRHHRGCGDHAESRDHRSGPVSVRRRAATTGVSINADSPSTSNSTCSR